MLFELKLWYTLQQIPSDMKILQTSLFIMMLCLMASALHAQSVEMRKLTSFSKIKSGGSWDLVLSEGGPSRSKN